MDKSSSQKEWFWRDLDLVCLCSGIMGLDTNDYVSLWIHQGEGSAQNLNTGVCKFSVTYVGSSDL